MSASCQRLPVSVKAFGSNRRRPPLWAVVFVCGGLVLAAISQANAAFVTTNEAGLDTVYSQSSFGETPVDIRFNPTVTFANGDLLNINTTERLDALFAFNDGDADNVISMYFVDTIDFCASFNPAIVGCADVDGNDSVVESAFAAGVFGTELLAHELGHSLNLPHVAFANLMTGVINGNTELLSDQVTTILGSPRIQFDGPMRFVEITPVLVTPLPPAGVLFFTALLALVWAQRRKRSSV